MRRRLVVITALALLACNDEGSGPDPGDLRLRAFVVNSLGGTLSVVGRRSDDGSLSARNDAAALGPGANAVTLAARAGVVAVPVGALNLLVVLDEDDLTTLCTAALPAGSSPFGVAVSGNKAFVTLSSTGAIARVDLRTCVVELVAPVGPAPGDVEVVGNVVLVVVGNIDLVSGTFPVPRFGDSYVAFLSPTTLAVLDTVSTGGENAQFAAVDRDGELLVVNTGDFFGENSSVSVVDPGTRARVAGPLPIGDSAVDLAVGPENRAYVTSFSEGLYVFDATTHRVLRGAGNPLAIPRDAEDKLRGASGVAVDRAGDVLFVSFGDGLTPGKVFLFEDGAQLVDSVTVGFGPVGAAFEEAEQPD